MPPIIGYIHLVIIQLAPSFDSSHTLVYTHWQNDIFHPIFQIDLLSKLA